MRRRTHDDAALDVGRAKTARDREAVVRGTMNYAEIYAIELVAYYIVVVRDSFVNDEANGTERASERHGTLSSARLTSRLITAADARVTHDDARAEHSFPYLNAFRLIVVICVARE